MSRRRALKRTLLAACAPWIRGSRCQAATSAERAVELARAEIWRRFIDQHGILLDLTDLDGAYLRPTPEECRVGKPNALGWWTPTENGSMFNGMYLDGAIARWKATGAAADRERVRQLVRGLMLLASIGPAGFVGRCVATDGRTPYPMGSNDQTGPWLYGIWRAIREGALEGDEREAARAKFLEIAGWLESTSWRMPCAGPPSAFRGSFAGMGWESAPRLLFLLKAAHDLTGDPHWDELYRRYTAERNGNAGRTRVDSCAGGMVFHGKWRESWTGASGAIALRGLWELEKDPALRAAYGRGLAASAVVAAPGVELCRRFDNDSQQACLHDWRQLNQWWRAQHSEADAVEVAEAQAKQLGRLSPRRGAEFFWVREPIFAAWVITLCPDADLVAKHRDGILEAFGHYRYERLCYSQFFPAEAAWWRLVR